MPSKKPGSSTPSSGDKKPDGRRNNKVGDDLKPYQWKKGQSGNPAGKKPDPPELKRLKNLTKAELVDVGNLIIKGDVGTLQRLAKDPQATVLQRMLAAVAAKIINKGDMQSLDVLLNRMVGKVKDEVALTSNLPQVVVNLPSNGREVKELPATQVRRDDDAAS